MRLFTFITCLVPTFAFAEVPRVVVDIAPVHGLVSRIMDGVGTPELLLPPNASPHSYAMRPSEARMLSQADVVVWVGPELTPWLSDAVQSLGSDAVQIALLTQTSVTPLAARSGLAFALEDEEGAGHDDDHDHEHDHDHDHAHDDNHDAQMLDPHAWLDVSNGVIWAASVADKLSEMDPENAATYAANWQRLADDVTAMSDRWNVPFSMISEQRYIVLHDAFQYFEAAQSLRAPLAIASSDASEPGAARISDLKAAIASSGVVCAFSEPQQSTKMIGLVTEGLDVKFATLDPLGSAFPLGPDHYMQTLGAVADAMIECLTP